MNDEQTRILAEIKRLDPAQWARPSNSLALHIERLEEQYKALTGQPCPAWPRRNK